MAKKVKEPTGVYNPFWTPETMTTFGGNLRFATNHAVTTIMDYSNDTHLPFYVLPKMSNRNVNSLHYLMLSNDGVAVPPSVNAIREVGIRRLLTTLWKNGRYEQFMIGMEWRNSHSMADVNYLIRHIKAAWDDTMKAQIVTTLDLPEVASCTGALNIIKAAKMGVSFGLGKIHSKSVRSGPWTHPQYLFGRYFLAHYVDLGADVIHHAGGTYETMFVPVPLVSLMFKIEHINLIRGYMLNNKEIPAELLELWVDESLDSLESPHPVRLQYVRNIRKPLEEAGVTIKVVPNLDTLMFSRMTLPKFKSVKIQKQWMDQITEFLVDKERVANGVTTKQDRIEKTLGSIFDLMDAKTTSDVSIVGAGVLKRDYMSVLP